MAYFAKVENGIVESVVAVPDEEEHRGQEFLNSIGLDGTWIQTSFNNNIRKQFAGVGFAYDSEADVFISPKPFPSWSLNSDFDWEAPTPRPGVEFVWDETSLSWVQVVSGPAGNPGYEVE